MQAQLSRDQHQMADLRLLAILDPLKRAAVDPGELGEALLGEVEVQPLDAHAVAHRPSGFEDPLRLIGWHPTNAAAGMIICPQQI